MRINCVGTKSPKKLSATDHFLGRDIRCYLAS